MKNNMFLWTWLLMVLCCPLPGLAQNTAQSDFTTKKLNLFLDCHRCYQQYLKDNINIINFVRDKNDAQIHLLITRAHTGSGGTEYSLSFIGKKKFKNINNQLVYVSSDTDTREETRNGLVKRIKVGLVSYILQTSYVQQIDVNYTDVQGEAANDNSDKWNHWVFGIGANTDLSGQEQQSSLRLEGDVSARRITQAWKVELQSNGNLKRQRFKLDDGDTTFFSNSTRFSALVVKSLSAHWSAGASSHISSSTFRNISFELGASPAVEYNIFPYRQYNKHEFSFLYKIAPTYFRYYDTTIFNKNEDFLVEQSLRVKYEVTQTWGSVQTSLKGSTFLRDLSKNQIEFRGDLNFRIFRGLSLNLHANYSLINNQIALPKGGTTTEEKLLQLRSEATGYKYYIGFGLNYTFGSIYNNIVNPRF